MGLFNRKDKDGAESADATSSASSAAPPTIETAAPPLTSAALENQPADKAPGPGPGEEDENQEYPTGLRLALLLISVMLTLFLVSLDRLIISTAIPQITNDFHSVTDIGWYGSAYLLTNSAFQLLFGRLYTIFSVKVVFLTAIFLFEAGSALCGAAPNSVAFIIGRAIAGLGGAGLISGVITTIVYAVPLHKRPLYQGLFGAVFGVSSVIGPLLGGAFTSKVTWRWCFYINLPFGGVAMVFIALLLKVPDRASTKLPLKEKILQLDLPGTACVLPGVICLLLALQWGGSTYPWSDGRIIALLVLAGVLLIGFVLVQVYLPKTATLPPRIFKQRSIIAGVWATICIGAQMMVFVYFLPIWFQAIQGVSAIDSGIRTLPMVLPMVLASIITGALVSRIGYYTPFMIIGNCIMAVGAGLLTTLQVDSSEGIWFGYQVLYGFGMGCTFQAPNMAAQTVLARDDVPIGSALMFFTQLLGGAVFISVAQNVLNSELLKRLSPLPGFNPKLLESNGATSLITQLPEAIRGTAVFEYNEALRKVFLVGLIMVCLALIGSVTMEWKSVKKDKKKDTKGGDVEKGGKNDVAEETDGEQGNAATAKGEKAYLDEKERDVGGGAVEEKEKEINA